MALGGLPECRHGLPVHQETDAQVRFLARRPEPVGRAIGPPRLLTRLVEGEAESHHARTLAPARDDLLAIRALQIEVPEDAEFVGVQAHCLDSVTIDRLTERAGWMDYRAIDSGRGHLGECVIDRIGRDLAMLRAHLAVLPDVNLRIDYQHGFLLKLSAPAKVAGNGMTLQFRYER